MQQWEDYGFTNAPVTGTLSVGATDRRSSNSCDCIKPIRHRQFQVRPTPPAALPAASWSDPSPPLRRGRRHALRRGNSPRPAGHGGAAAAPPSFPDTVTPLLRRGRRGKTTESAPRLPTSGSRHGLCPSRSAAGGQRHLPPAAAAQPSSAPHRTAPHRRPPTRPALPASTCPAAAASPPPAGVTGAPGARPAPRPRRQGGTPPGPAGGTHTG